MVVGSGLIAGSFSSFADAKDVLVFASGVSNSKSLDEAAYQREVDLVKSFDAFEGLFIYFSTCSIYDPLLKDSRYILHKISVEDHIRKHHQRHFIVRLPNVVGPCANPHTLMNFIYNSISLGTEMKIQVQTTRYLVHIVDVAAAVTSVVQSNEGLACTANLVLHEKYFVRDVVRAFEEYLGKKANATYLDEGLSYDVQCDALFREAVAEIETDHRKALQRMIGISYAAVRH